MSVFRSLICGTGLALAMASGSLADSRNCKLFNSSDAPIAAVQVRPSGQGRWQGNLLVQRMIGVSRSEVVQITTPPCVYDFFVTFDDGHRRIIPNVDVCHRSSLSIAGR
jgi:hypothetical protein